MDLKVISRKIGKSYPTVLQSFGRMILFWLETVLTFCLVKYVSFELATFVIHFHQS